MKRFISLIAVLVMLVPFAACEKAPGKEAAKSPAPTELVSEKTAEPTEAPAEDPEETLPEVYAGDDVFFVLYPDGSLYGWGSNGHGQVGCGASEDVAQPEKIAEGIVRVYMGAATVFALDGEGWLRGWGCNERGALGTGDTEDRRSPVKILGGVKDAALGVTGEWFALKENGDLMKWGFPYSSAFGFSDDDVRAALTPSLFMENVRSFDGRFVITRNGELISVTEPETAAAEGVSEAYHGCGLVLIRREDGGLWAAKDVWDGGGRSENPEFSFLTDGARSVTEGGDGMYVLTDNGELYVCAPADGAPELTKKLDGVRSVVTAFDSGGTHVEFAVRENGELWSWGDGYESHAFQRDPDADFSVPALIFEGVRSVYSNCEQTYIILENGEVWAAGLDHPAWGALGAGANENGEAAVSDFVRLDIEDAAYIVTRLTDDMRYAGAAFSSPEGTADRRFAAVVVYMRTFAVLKDGTVLAWGFNGDGYLGTGEGGAMVFTPTVILPKEDRQDKNRA